MSARVRALPLKPRSAAALTFVSLVGAVAFCWPLFAHPKGTVDTAHAGDAPWLFVLLLPLILAVLFAELSEGALDAKAVAMLGVLAAFGAGLRLPGGGAGVELVFFLVVLGGYALGRGFGFVLGAVTLFASALLTAGVGPWLPFQMLGAGWVGLFAGFLPHPKRPWAELGVLAAYGVVSAFVYGFVLNLWFWPFGISGSSSLAFVPDASLVVNARHFWAFHVSSSLGFDAVRAVSNVVLLLAVGRPVLAALRRAARRAAFGETPEFS
ncbi:MAG TPA: ECF transporter S component [Mycobacteriales bacterium]|jgi:energy-coupling factor transport system substrate-specific component|nr:ECF transporter S component [Mycobacteriales bacterium]